MWTVKPAQIPVQFYKRRAGGNPIGYSQLPPRNHEGIYRHRRLCNIPTKSQTNESESVSGIGQQILLRFAESNSNKLIPNEKEMSGSDVLRAIQRATAQRKRSSEDKRKKKKITEEKLSSSTGESTGDNGVDYSNVRPLRIKSDWGQRLEEFEKLLKDFKDS